MKNFIKLICFIAAALFVLPLFSACVNPGEETVTGQITQKEADTPDNCGVYIASGYRKTAVESNRTLADWLTTCGDSEHSMIENYAIYKKQKTDSGVTYEYFVYRPGCKGRSCAVDYDLSSTDSTYVLKLNYTETEDGGDCEIISVRLEVGTDKRVSLSVSDNGQENVGIISTNAGDADFSLIVPCE